MKVGDGTDYSQNYDLIVKWLSAAFRGETLEVLGLETGRIMDVFGFDILAIREKSEVLMYC